MATAQFGINFNLGILNGAATTTGMTIALPYSEGFSDLPSSMAPNGASTVATGLIRIAGRAARVVPMVLLFQKLVQVPVPTGSGLPVQFLSLPIQPLTLFLPQTLQL